MTSAVQGQPEKKPRPRIKKVKGHGGHHGGAWKVAYADFVTAMMALFLVLWLVSQADTKLKASIANYFRSPGAFDTVSGGVLSGQEKVSKEPNKNSANLEEQLLTDIATFLRQQFMNRPEFSELKDQIKVTVTAEGLEIEIIDKDESVSFASGSAELTPEAKSILDVIAKSIKDLPNPIKIAGHTDRKNYPEGSTYTNWELSTDRANAARRQLESAGLDHVKIDSVNGYADSRLADPENPYAAKNRRITIVVARTAAESAEDAADAARAPKPAFVDEAAPKAPASKTARPPATDEEKLAKHKLETEGAVDVGAPDEPPPGASRVRERPAAKPASH